MVAPHLLVNVNNETNHNATLLCPDSFGSNKDMVGETSNHVDNNDDGQAINDDSNLNLSNIFVRNLALFYLKLNAQCHVPSSTGSFAQNPSPPQNKSKYGTCEESKQSWVALCVTTYCSCTRFLDVIQHLVPLELESHSSQEIL